MEASMSSAFTTAHRRKRIATYGKSSRPTPNFNWNNDALSPERPQKRVGGLNGALKKPGTTYGADERLPGVGTTQPSLLQSPTSRDIFDEPFEEIAPLPSPSRIKKTSSKQAAPIDEFDVPPSSDELSPPRSRLGKAPHPFRKPDAQRRQVPAPKQPCKDEFEVPSSDEAPPPIRRRGKTPQSLQKSNLGNQQAPAAKRPVVKPKPASRATTPAPPTAATHKGNKGAPNPFLKKPSTAKTTLDLDIFDVPSSEDEDLIQQTPGEPLLAPISRAKSPILSRVPSTQPSPGPYVESDDSNASRKRKRQALSKACHEPKPATVVDTKREKSAPQRSKEYQKKEGSISPGHDAVVSGKTPVSVMPAKKHSGINKPQRTRTRTVPGPARLPVTKGQSSPAKLHGILAVRESKPLTKPSSPIPILPADSIIEDETMYDILEPTPAHQATKPTIAESVTPRQKQMFSNLLGDSSETTTPGLPSIGRLQISDQRTAGPMAGLARSSSDIPHTTYSRKPRLIDTLIQAAPDLGEEDESDSEEATVVQVTSTPAIKQTFGKTQIPVDLLEGMDMDSEPPSNSQASQSALHMNGGPRVTYAKQRSYLEESTLEENLLLMDMDDIPGVGGFGRKQAPQSVSDDEDDPTSQVTGIHELRKKGQNRKFHWEVEATIDDIANKGGLGNSSRRSAMLEFCTKLADEKFVEQFFETTLDERLYRSLFSNGEVIFDFAAAAAIAFILKTGPGFNVLGQIYGSDVMTTLTKLLDTDTDINRIAKERKTNLSRVGRESVAEFRKLVQESSIWSPGKPDTVSPQIVAMKTIEILVIAVRKAGSTENLLDEIIISKLLDIASSPCDRLKTGPASAQDLMILELTFSIIEAVSISKDKQATWSNRLLRRVVDMIPVFFNADSASPIKLAIRLCMNLTNNKPKACETFAGPTFIQPLVNGINQKFALLTSVLSEEQRMEVLEGLILSLGAMINLAEFSDTARTSVVMGGDELVDALAKTFLEGFERAAQADSMEESQFSVATGYLTVLLGNLCLNDHVRYKIRSRLPGKKLDVLVAAIKEFIHYNEKVDRDTKGQFDGDEGKETWRNFTMRLMAVVERLEKAEA
ncbi:hypothetical protein K469DRAFT_633400 [Zopfia rhizophila CBS 207.26]|uniref:Wings apart-like protein C-terminal domain-containing protein n=1 Tax=Zopfia rhizophila CBS 207.26 TaxID=1314779 RepID=A0A6A6E0A8_9PEZI|nr:hypothetical protein K469DRAFT_633400 [Zopfia rhizophila CBS 207.26]